MADDLIRRKDAIDLIENESRTYGDEYGVSDVLCDLADMPSAQPEPRWIPCSERLPDKADGKYWVCTDTGYQCQCRWTDNVYGLGSSGEWAWKIFDIPQYSHVIAWMPLPEPPKEEEK